MPDCVIKRCNRKILAKNGVSMVQKIWGICKQLGATYKCEEEVMVNFAEKLKDRDRECKVVLGIINGVP